MKSYVAAADARWAEWYGDDYQSIYSTNCYVSVDVGEPLSDYVAQLTAATSSSVLNLSTLYGAAVRLAFHDAGEANMASSSDMMGPDGCLSTSGDNAGLVESDSIVYTTFEPVWQGLCGKISRADFWVLLAKLCLETAEPTDVLSIPFQFGRIDATSCSAGADRLPSALGDLTEYRQVFVTQMGLTLADAVVLVGAHSLGHMHPDNSGFGLSGSCSDGYLNAWDDTPHIFDNHYHFNLEVHNWQNQLAPYRQTNSQAQWYSLVNANTIMMPSDLAIAYQLNFNYGSFTSQTCGPKGVGASTNRYTGAITLGTSYGCSPSNGTMPETCQTACLFGNTNSYFLTSFATSFVKMVCVGYGVPAQVDGATASGKIGTLTHIDLTTC
eukprot:gene21863-27938_t